ncbi:hypothetical protein GCM10010307_57480 [Streptomyces vastus]|uniref:RDD family protein n=1 Tax=Streptomyces vastus TaxID=285451 RepID=A0ABP6DRF2_9ACTN
MSIAAIPNERWDPRMERKSGCEATLFSAEGAGGICPGWELKGELECLGIPCLVWGLVFAVCTRKLLTEYAGGRLLNAAHVFGRTGREFARNATETVFRLYWLASLVGWPARRIGLWHSIVSTINRIIAIDRG